MKSPVAATGRCEAGMAAIVRLDVDGNMTTHLCALARAVFSQVVEVTWPMGWETHWGADGLPLQSVDCWLACSDGLDANAQAFAEWVRSRYPNTGLLLVARTCARDEEKAAILRGADDCLPADDLDWVCQRARALLRHRPVRRPVAPEAELDERELTLRLSSGSTRLTRTEFRIVQYLWHRNEMWVPHEQLMQHALGITEAKDTALVRVHLSNIRRKLRGGPQILVTRRTLGTRMCLPKGNSGHPD